MLLLTVIIWISVAKTRGGGLFSDAPLLRRKVGLGVVGLAVVGDGDVEADVVADAGSTDGSFADSDATGVGCTIASGV